MIIVGMKGGLGNQMFQYALGKSLSLRNNIPTKIDNSNYTSSIGDPFKGIRLFGLSYFNIEEHIASPEELARFSKFISSHSVAGKINRALNKIGPYYSKSYIVEPKKNFFSFDKKLLIYPIKKDVYISGYWQSEKYFEQYADIIKKEFTLKASPEGKNKTALENIKSQNSVAIHVRHGDNANAIAKNHGVLSIKYYRQALEIVKAKVELPFYYLFSDDIVWASEQFRDIQSLTVVDWNGDEKNHEDIRLMYSCRHHIIGNSSFSWWGAWLGSKEGQIVIAPKRYYQAVNMHNPDYYPKEWIIL